MSYAEDFISECEADIDLNYMGVEIDAESGYWTTKDGDRIHVSDMSDSHIRNTINYIKRVDKTDMYLPWIERFNKELQRREEERMSLKEDHNSSSFPYSGDYFFQGCFCYGKVSNNNDYRAFDSVDDYIKFRDENPLESSKTKEEVDNPYFDEYER